MINYAFKENFLTVSQYWTKTTSLLKAAASAASLSSTKCL